MPRWTSSSPTRWRPPVCRSPRACRRSSSGSPGPRRGAIRAHVEVQGTPTWALIAPNFLKLGGKETVEGVMAVTSYTPDHSENAKKLHAKVEQRFKDQGGDFHPVATAQTYDGTRLVLRALDRVG